MNPFEMPAAPITSKTVAQSERILDTLLLVARRADVLARRQQKAGRETDRRVWLRAEFEIFEVSSPSHVDVSAHAA